MTTEAKKEFIEKELIDKILSDEFDECSNNDFCSICEFIQSKLMDSRPLPIPKSDPVDWLTDILLGSFNYAPIYYVCDKEGLNAAATLIKNLLLIYGAAAGIMYKFCWQYIGLPDNRRLTYVNANKWESEPITLYFYDTAGNREITIEMHPGKNITTTNTFKDIIIYLEAKDETQKILWSDSIKIKDFNKDYLIEHFNKYVQ